jgi:hypothetical protein
VKNLIYIPGLDLGVRNFRHILVQGISFSDGFGVYTGWNSWQNTAAMPLDAERFNNQFVSKLVLLSI